MFPNGKSGDEIRYEPGSFHSIFRWSLWQVSGVLGVGIIYLITGNIDVLSGIQLRSICESHCLPVWEAVSIRRRQMLP